MNPKQAVLMFLTPVATAFVDYLVNNTSPFSKSALSHAGLSSLLVGLALLEKYIAGQNAPAPAVSAPAPPAAKAN